MLTSLVHVSEKKNPSFEDIFSTALNLISPDNIPNSHGDPGNFVTYHSERFGAITLRLAQPQNEQERKMFGQYLWNASILLAEMIGNASEEENPQTHDKPSPWAVKNESLLELGAGTGLVGIVGMLSGAEEVVISDYPGAELLSTIEANIKANIPSSSYSSSSSSSPPLPPCITVHPHKWGHLTSPFSLTHAHHFSRILAADCLWLASEHENLTKSMLHFLSWDSRARVWVVAGFHTGRGCVEGFLEEAGKAGLDVERVFERDVEGNVRAWRRMEEGEGVGEGQRESLGELGKWLVVAVLKRGKPRSGSQVQAPS